MSGTRKNGNEGQISVPLNDGQAVSNAALTPSASKTIMGTAYTDRFCGHTLTHWNRKATASTPISVRVTGIIGAPTITPHASADKCVTSAFTLYKDNGTAITVPADTDVSLSRPVGDVAKWNAIVVSDAGAVTAVAGTDASDTTFLETFGTAAGTIPFTPVGSYLCGLVKLSASASAVIVPADVCYTLPTAGTLIQERSDIPSYKILPMEGGILLDSALIKNHTGSLARVVYASFMSQKNCLAALYHTMSWSLSTSRAIGDMPAQRDIATDSDFTGPLTWSGSFDRYSVDSILAKLAVYGGTGCVKLYPDANIPAEYWEGTVRFGSFGTGAAQGSPNKDTLSFNGDGTLEWREA